MVIFAGDLYRPLACGGETICKDVTNSSATALEMFHVITVYLELAGN